MKSRLFWSTGISILLLFMLSIIYKVTYAQGETGGERTKIVNISYTAYTWRLISNSKNKLLCEIIIDHEGYPTEVETIIACPELMNPQNPTALPPLPTNTVKPGKKTPTSEPAPTMVPTPSPVDYAELLRVNHWQLMSSKTISRSEKIPIPDIIVSIDFPSGPVSHPYVTISAVEPVEGYQITNIQGTLGDIPFECPNAICDLQFNYDSQITFWASSSFGDESKKNSITARVSQDAKGYYVTISNLIPISQYSDACSKIWGTEMNPPLASWSFLPNSPTDLFTDENLYLLSGQLISHGIVDTSSCPGNGLFDVGIPNACGFETSKPMIISWQNRFNVDIWEASRGIGIPAWLIKSVIEVESQFWPANIKYHFVEYGLGQVNLYGAETALHWDPDLQAMVCQDLVYNCNRNYLALSPQTKLVLQGGLIRMLNAECSDCQFGIDLNLAGQSITPFSRILRSECRQTAYILSNQKKAATYDDLWRFSLVGYHSGYQCLENAVRNVTDRDEPLDWSHLATYLETDCPGSVAYVDHIFNLIYANSQPSRPKGPSIQGPHSTAILQGKPPNNPHPLINGSLDVIVYMDYNNDKKPSDNEKLDNLAVDITFADQSTRREFTVNGEVKINYSGQPVGSTVTVALPLVYQEMSFDIPGNGNTTLVFRLTAPNLPSGLP
jgi:hypothetical protein